jgi:hypothetical protein
MVVVIEAEHGDNLRVALPEGRRRLAKRRDYRDNALAIKPRFSRLVI